MKIFFARFTDAIVKTKILKGANSSVLLNTSTFDSLLPLSIVLNETRRAKNEAHIFLEDKSATFDSISY
jgi:hypothetical protein